MHSAQAHCASGATMGVLHRWAPPLEWSWRTVCMVNGESFLGDVTKLYSRVLELYIEPKLTQSKKKEKKKDTKARREHTREQLNLKK